MPVSNLDLKYLCAIVGALVLISAPAGAADDLTGQASIIDGDTLEIHGTRIRLWGIDAPESSQLCRGEDSLQYRCGAKSANEIDAFIARRPISCIPISLDLSGGAGASYREISAKPAEWCSVGMMRWPRSITLRPCRAAIVSSGVNFT
jgi:hypothetical protein